MVRVDGDTISIGHSFSGRRDQLLLLFYPAVHIEVGELGNPPSEGLRGPLRRPGAPRCAGAVRAVRAVGPTVWLVHSRGSFSWRSVSIFCLTLSQQCASAEAGFKGRLS